MTDLELKDMQADCKEAAADLTMILKYVQEKYPTVKFTVSVEHPDNSHPIVTIEGDDNGHKSTIEDESGYGRTK